MPSNNVEFSDILIRLELCVPLLSETPSNGIGINQGLLR